MLPTQDRTSVPPRPQGFRTLWERAKRHPLMHVGPGMITGVADDDPSGIATYSQAGAQFGFGMLWTMPLAFPLMAAVQSMCASIGRVTGKGLAANIKDSFPPGILWAAVLLLLVANTLNIAADVAAMGEVAQLVTGVDRHLMTAVFVFVTLGLQIFVPYHRYVRILKWLTLSLLAYAAVLFTVHVPWRHVLHETIRPTFTPNAAAAAVIVGIFGTTISPYLFFWQSSEEVEDMQAGRRGRGSAATPSLLVDRAAAAPELRRIGWDTWSGMLYSNLTAFFIILATAVTLHVAGVTDIETATQAAQALRPLAGDFAFHLFALGILGVGAVGVPVLAGSAAYAIAEALGWPAGLESRAADARGFYGVIAVSMIAGLGLGFTSINPIKALFYSAVINGVVAVPLIALILLLAMRPSVLGAHTASRTSLVLGWITVLLMAAASVGMLIPA